MSTRPSSERFPPAAHDSNETATVSGSDQPGALVSPCFKQPPYKAPHWFLPNKLPTGSVRCPTVTGDSASVESSTMSTSVHEGQGQATPYNAWGPNGEYARMVKVPTAASDTTRSAQSVHHPSRTINQSKSSWAKVVSDAPQSCSYLGTSACTDPQKPSRKHAPQLPNYLKDDMPMTADNNDDGLELDSDEDIIRINH